MNDQKAKTRTAAAVEALKALGYTWFPIAQEWRHTPGLPLLEVCGAPGWYRCAQVKLGQRGGASWDGYTFVTKENQVIHFDLTLKQRRWSPPIGYESRVCFIPVEIRDEVCADPS